MTDKQQTVMKQTLIKITDDHYVVVDDSEIKEGDWVFNEKSKKIYIITIIEDIVYYEKKITHSTNIMTNGMGILYISEIKELIGKVDVEKKMISPYPMDTQNDIDWCNGYQRGYNQALEDNKDKKYTEMDMKHMFECGRNYQNNAEITFKVSIDYLQHEAQWKVTFDEQGKLRLV